MGSTFIARLAAGRTINRPNTSATVCGDRSVENVQFDHVGRRDLIPTRLNAFFWALTGNADAELKNLVHPFIMGVN
jgi:hypothetical protein